MKLPGLPALARRFKRATPIIERYSTNRRFGDERYTIYGSSRTQLLAAPYAPQRSKSNSANLNAKQAITEELWPTPALRLPIQI